MSQVVRDKLKDATSSGVVAFGKLHFDVYLLVFGSVVSATSVSTVDKVSIDSFDKLRGVMSVV